MSVVLGATAYNMKLVTYLIEHLRIRYTYVYSSIRQYKQSKRRKADTLEEFNVDSKAELDLAHVARKKYEKEETKTNKRQCPLSSVQVQDQDP